ncbi:hypothetical protein TNCV_4316711 [Trichonephila clavipes]|nr:hypothetical protein TNCV_4316711 [Trichonephila clavipes]
MPSRAINLAVVDGHMVGVFRVLVPLTHHAEGEMHIKSVEAQSPPVGVVVWRGGASSGGCRPCHLTEVHRQ